MVTNKFSFVFLLVFLLTNLANAQETIIVGSTNINTTQNSKGSDTIPSIDINDPELNKIIDLRTQFEKENRTYTTPVTPSENLLRFLGKEEEARLSDEALYWAHLVRDASTIFDNSLTFQDTIIVNPLFLTPIFQGKLLPDDLSFYKDNFWIKNEQLPLPFVPDTIFADKVRFKKIGDKAFAYVEKYYPDHFHYSQQDLPRDKVQAKEIRKTHYEPELIKIESDANFNDVTTPVKFIPERRYWTSHFESSLLFAQNYISPNWHKGGVSTLNLNNREFFTYNYNKEKVQFTNLLEIKNNLYTAPKDTLREYKVGDDVFRIYSNFGYKAFSKWYYTLEMDFRTQLFSSFEENKDVKLAGLLSPFSINFGLGMKYELNKTFAKRHKNISLTANIAPLSYTYVRTIDKDIDLGRHFQKEENAEEFPYKQSLFGSTVNATMTFQFNRNITWYSRLNYTTNYQRIQGEFENRLTMAISRFFSTVITLNLRYDDGIEKKEDFDSYLQINEQLSFGFNYKW